MQFVMRCRLAFDQMLATLGEHVARRGFMVRRNFDLDSALDAPAPPDIHYSIILVYSASDALPHVLVAHGEHDRLRLTLTGGSAGDHASAALQAALAEALVEMGCWSWEEPRSDERVVDPVCGRAIVLQGAHAVIERDGRLVHLCCPLCLAEFEQNPERYAGHKTG